MRTLFRFVIVACVLSMGADARGDEPQATTAAASPAATQPTTLPTWTRTRDVIYGRTAGTALTFDVYTPKENANGAAVILVASGGWAASHEALDSPFLSIFIGPFIRHGYTVFGVVPASQPKFTIPEIAENVDKSVRFIRANAERFKIDSEKLGITGGSAGGHLSLLQATKPTPGKTLSLSALERASGRVQAAAVLFPPTDFLNYRSAGMNVMEDPLIDPFHAAFDFREMSKERHTLIPVSRRRHAEILHETSPARCVTSETPPCMIIHGDKDELVPIQQATLFMDKLKAAGVPGELVVKEGAGHGWAKPEVEIELMAVFFDKHLLGKGKESP
jgi:acetyl esterase/lipase